MPGAISLDQGTTSAHIPFLRSKKAVLPALGLVLWLLAVIGGGHWVYARSFDAGSAGSPQAVWPADSHLRRAANRYTLVVALHPECPCSSATVDELADLVSQSANRLAVHILMVQYPELEERAEASPLWKKASAIPGVTLVVDPGATEAHRFDARTSGETRLYDSRGMLVFHGGITLARGHVGDNPGQTAVRDRVLRDSSGSAASAPVFGCAL